MTDERARGFVPFVYAVLVVVATLSRLGGLAPPAFGQDDLWVAAIVKHITPADLLTYRAPVPMGFVASLELCGQLLAGREWSLQVVPFLAGLALIPLAGWTATQLTGRREVGILAAVLVLLHPLGGAFAVRVKQFTWDAATTLALIGIALRWLDPTRRDRPWGIAVASSIALVASFNAIFAGIALCHARLLMAWIHRRTGGFSVGKALAAALAFDAFAVAFYVGRIAHQSADWIVRYWQRRNAFPPQSAALSGGIDVDWLLAALGRGYGQWFPGGAAAGVVLALAGILYLLSGRRTRFQGLVFAGLACAFPTAALAFYYPFGGIRTDYYFAPLLAVLGAVGIAGIAAGLSSALARAGAAVSAVDRLRLALPLLVAVVLAFAIGLTPVRYGHGTLTSQYRDLVEALDATVGPDDLVLLSPYARWNVAYYTTRPLRLDFANPKDRLFDADLARPASRVLAKLPDDLERPDLPDRIVFLALFAGEPNLVRYRAAFEAAGYGLASEQRPDSPGSALQVWQRAAAAPGEDLGSAGHPIMRVAARLEQAPLPGVRETVCVRPCPRSGFHRGGGLRRRPLQATAG